jgi:hypothetical protein
MASKRVLSAAGPGAGQSLPIVDIVVLSDLENHLGKPKVMRLAALFREQVTEAINTIISTTDRRLIGEQSHAIVSLAGNLGCTELMTRSRALMEAARSETGDLDPLVAEVAAAVDRALSAVQDRYTGAESH